MELLEAVSARRSVRDFLDSPVSQDKINRLLDAARWAPSWANTQCARYIIVRDPQIKTALKETLSPTNPARGAFDTCPVLIAVIAQLGLSGHKRGAPVDDRQWFMFDCALAVQNISLAACALGLGTVIVGSFDYKKAGEILAVPQGFQTVVILPVGFPKTIPSAPSRKAVSETAFKDKFAQPLT